jgi:hypothetical protein
MSDVPAEGQGWEAWAPPLNPPDPAGMPREVAQGIADTYWPGEPYICAGLQWQWYALSLKPAPAMSSVSTGVQTVSYANAKSAFDAAMERAQWFFDAEFGSLVSVPLVSNVADAAWGPAWAPLRDMNWWIDP